MKNLKIMLALSVFLVACSPETPAPATEAVTEAVTEAQTEGTEVTNTVETTEVQTETATNTNAKFIYAPENVEVFELDIERTDDKDIEYKFHKGQDKAMVKREDTNINLNGDEAKTEVMNLLGQINVNVDRPLKEMMDEILEAIGISATDIENFDVELTQNDGKKLDFQYDREENAENREVDEFNLEIHLTDGTNIDYDYEINDEYSIEGRESLKGDEAKQRIEALMNAMNVSMDRSIRELQDAALAELGITMDEVKKFDVDVEYADGAEINVEMNYMTR